LDHDRSARIRLHLSASDLLPMICDSHGAVVKLFTALEMRDL
jgi:hypothetical protein